MQAVDVEGIPDTKGLSPLIASMTRPTYVGDKPQHVGTPTHPTSKPLVSFFFELNPLDRSCNQNIALKTQSMNVVYHAVCCSQSVLSQLSDLYLNCIYICVYATRVRYGNL